MKIVDVVVACYKTKKKRFIGTSDRAATNMEGAG
jgi:hypothetical protein